MKKYGDRTNEWRVFYLGDNVLSMCRNSGQLDFVSEVPKSLVEKYRKLPSPFYTVDYAELEDGSWMILEAGDGQVSGLSDGQNERAFFRGIKSFQINKCLGCQRKEITEKMICWSCMRNIVVAVELNKFTIITHCPKCGAFASTYFSPCEKAAMKLKSSYGHTIDKSTNEYVKKHVDYFKKGGDCPYDENVNN